MVVLNLFLVFCLFVVIENSNNINKLNYFLSNKYKIFIYLFEQNFIIILY
jgi:hypothetical protein